MSWCLSVQLSDCLYCFCILMTASQCSIYFNNTFCVFSFWHRTIRINKNWLDSLAKLMDKRKNFYVINTEYQLMWQYKCFSIQRYTSRLCICRMQPNTHAIGTCRWNSPEIYWDESASVTFLNIWNFTLRLTHYSLPRGRFFFFFILVFFCSSSSSSSTKKI